MAIDPISAKALASAIQKAGAASSIESLPAAGVVASASRVVTYTITGGT